MQYVEIPLARCLQRAVTLALAIAAVLVMLAPLAWAWRVAAVALVALAGILAWRYHLRIRPVRLLMHADGRLDCSLADGRCVAVERIDEGTIRPWLVSARLRHAQGVCDLFVPGRALDGAAHWRLRRMLTAFRPPQSTGRRGT